MLSQDQVSGERQESVSEGWKKGWKSVAVWSGGGWEDSLGSPRDLGWRRLLGINAGDLSGDT